MESLHWKNILAKVTGSSGNGPSRISGPGGGGGMSEPKGRFGGGIGNSPGVGGGPRPMSMPVNSAYMGSGGVLAGWTEDRMDQIMVITRGLQVLFAFIILIIAIVLATFQNRWIGSLSGLTGFLLTVTVVTLVFGGILMGMPFLPQRLQDSLHKTYRLIDTPRVGIIINGLSFGLWIIMSVTETISAYTSAGCKNADNDPHAKSSKGKEDDFKNALPTFCTAKKVAAAFCWFLWLTAIATTLLFLRAWRLSRKNGPRIPPFVHPTDDSAFEPIADDADEEAAGLVGTGMPEDDGYRGRYGDGGDGQYGMGGAYDDGGRYGYGNAAGGYGNAAGGYDNAAGGYGNAAGGYGGGDHGMDAYGSTMAPQQQQQQSAYQQQDPFADRMAQQPPPRMSYDYGAYSQPNHSSAQIHQDPYSAIQYQLNNQRAPEGPPQLPPLYR